VRGGPRRSEDRDKRATSKGRRRDVDEEEGEVEDAMQRISRGEKNEEEVGVEVVDGGFPASADYGVSLAANERSASR